MNKKPKHGTESVMSGKLKGQTDATDYFYFLCPKCGGEHICRIIDYTITKEEKDNPYNDDFKRKAKRSFIIAFELYCENCGFRDCVKLSNIGWQGGKIGDAIQRGIR